MGLRAILQDSPGSNRVPASSPCGTAPCWDSGSGANDSALVKIRKHSQPHMGIYEEFDISESVNILASVAVAIMLQFSDGSMTPTIMRGGSPTNFESHQRQVKSSCTTVCVSISHLGRESSTQPSSRFITGTPFQS